LIIFLHGYYILEGEGHDHHPRGVGATVRESFILYNGLMMKNSRTEYISPHVASSKEATQHVHEREKLKSTPPFFMAIPTVPRKENVPYLLDTILSISDAGFPLKNVYVFYHGNPKESTHRRWEEAETMLSSEGMHFLWNVAPIPEPHPSVNNMSHPFPDWVDQKIYPGIRMEEVHMARGDEVDRKKWRIKECHDFRTLSQYMLHVVYDGVDPYDQSDVMKRNNTWIIFNQDDAIWETSFFNVFTRLYQLAPEVGHYSLSKEGLVCMGFRASYLSLIVDYAERWCDFLPVDWMIWSFHRSDHNYTGLPPKNLNLKWIKHIGKVSSRAGRVVEEPPTKEPPKKKVIIKQPDSRQKKLSVLKVVKDLKDETEQQPQDKTKLVKPNEEEKREEPSPAQERGT
jgi:hypothetical protein